VTSDDVIKLLGSGIVGGLISLFAREVLEKDKLWSALKADLAGTLRLLTRYEEQMAENVVASEALWSVMKTGALPTFDQVTALKSGWVISPSGVNLASSLEKMGAERQAFLVAYLDYWHQVMEREIRYRETLDALLQEIASDHARNDVPRRELAVRVKERAFALAVATRKLLVVTQRAIDGTYEQLPDRCIGKLEAGQDWRTSCR
jgi:hypothetical protein